MLSAIITTYKRPPEIVERAAKSILNQTYKDIELIIVDDSPSTYELRDSVREMAMLLGENVKYIQHAENKGACAARNTGMENANGEFIAFLDDDDEWIPEKIEKQIQVMENNKDTALVYCGRYTHYTGSGKTVEQKVNFHRGNIYNKLILENFVGSTSFPLIKKSVLLDLGGFDVNMPAAQDLELWLRIAKKHYVDYTPEPLVRYYVHAGEQITKNHSKKVEAYERLNELNMDYLEKHPKAYTIRLLKQAIICADVDLKKARALLFKAIRIWPVPSIELLRAVKWLYVMPILKK